jgi:hypothetical protein
MNRAANQPQAAPSEIALFVMAITFFRRVIPRWDKVQRNHPGCPGFGYDRPGEPDGLVLGCP